MFSNMIDLWRLCTPKIQITQICVKFDTDRPKPGIHRICVKALYTDLCSAVVCQICVIFQPSICVKFYTDLGNFYRTWFFAVFIIKTRFSIDFKNKTSFILVYWLNKYTNKIFLATFDALLPVLWLSIIVIFGLELASPDSDENNITMTTRMAS